MSEAAATAVECSVLVNAPIERAFEVFTADIGSWWPPDHHILQAELAAMVFEPRVGGHVYDRGTDGTECRWATVLAYEPPRRLVVSWNISLSWQLEADPNKVSEVEVSFSEEGAQHTRVVLEHRHLDRHGEGWEQMRGAVSSDGGWKVGLRRFADRAEAVPAPRAP